MDSKPSSYRLPRSATRHGAALTWILLLLSLTIAGAVAWTRVSASDSDSQSLDDILCHEIAREHFSLEVNERGEIKSSGGIDIRCEVKAMNSTGTAILRIVPEGTQVAEGDFLVEFDSSALESDRLLQQINVNTAEASVIEAQNLYETAVIAVREYLEGLFVQERQTIESEVFVAEENLSRSEEYLEYSKRLAAKGYVSELQLEADRFAVDKSKKELAAAKTKLKVLEEFTKEKTLKQLQSDRAIAKAKWESLKNSYQLELDKLEDIVDQIDKCLIHSPGAGTVTYVHGAEGRRGGGNEFVVEEGAVVRERQIFIRLPDTSSMIVEVEINESLIQHVREGMPAAVRLVGGGEEVLRGRVSRVNQYAQPTNWRRANVKDYKAFIAIEEIPSALKSGMTASVTISAMYVADALLTPVQSVYAHGDKVYCFVDNNGELLARQVMLGPTNDRHYVVEAGLEPGDLVALNPRRIVDRVDLPELMPEQKQRSVETGSDWRELRERQKPAAQAGGTTAATKNATALEAS